MAYEMVWNPLLKIPLQVTYCQRDFAGFHTLVSQISDWFWFPYLFCVKVRAHKYEEHITCLINFLF